MKRTLITTAALVLATALTARAETLDTRLLDAVRANDLTQVQHLLHRGVPADAADASGNTALMIAAACGYLELTQLLIDRGAALDARGDLGNTALLYAAQEGHAQIVRLLVDHGADPTVRNQYGASIAKLAVGWGHRDVAQVLQESQPTLWLAGDGLGQKLVHTLIALITIVAIPALTARVAYASVLLPHAHR